MENVEIKLVNCDKKTAVFLRCIAHFFCDPESKHLVDLIKSGKTAIQMRKDGVPALINPRNYRDPNETPEAFRDHEIKDTRLSINQMN